MALLFRGQLGEYLVQKGWLGKEELELALEEHKKSGKRLGEVLLSMGLITKRQLLEALAAQLGVRAWDAKAEPIDAKAARMVSEWAARKYRLVPVRVNGRKLAVAMADPTDLEALEEVRLLSGLDPEPLLGDEDDIKEAVGRIFGLLESVERAAKASRRAQGREGPGEERGDRDEDAGPPIQDEERAPVIEFVQNLLEQAVREKASDIHIEPGEGSFSIRFRVDGALHVAMRPELDLHQEVVSRLKVLAGMDIAERRVPQDGRFTMAVDGREYDCRCSAMPTVHGEKMVIRLLDKQGGASSVDSLGFPEDVARKLRELVHRPYGMILITGPTGSGKSTTLAAMLREIDRERLNVVTIEDPVEYEIPGVNHSQVNTRAGLTFAAALRSFLRQDPDVIMVGEIRDRETADTAVRAALTGHLLLSTLHTNDAPTSIARLVDMGMEPFLIASSLLAVLAQRLVRVLCPICREPYPAEEAKAVFERAGIAVATSATLYRPHGCEACRNGYLGRTVVAELMDIGPRLRTLIGERASSDEIRRTAVEAGMKPLRSAGLELALRGVTSVEEVLRVTEERDA